LVLEGDDLGAHRTWDARGISVTTGAAKSGTITVVYAIQDATKDPSRQVQARLTIIVASAPEPVTDFTLSNPGSRNVTVVFQPPSSSNGAEITGYTVQISGPQGSEQRTDCSPGAACSFTARNNGEVQTVDVSATNRVGTTGSASRSITPYGTPAAPATVSASDGAPGTGRVNLSWAASADSGGGNPDYQWRQLPSGGWNSVGAALSAQPNIGVGNSASFAVQVCNTGGLCSNEVASGPATAPPPPASVALSKGKYAGDQTGCTSHNCSFLHLNVSNFAPNASLEADCNTNGSYYFQQNITTNSNGSWSGDLNCWSGYQSTAATVAGVASNPVDFR
ncbi:MAG: fibronectin type III domain-containing protein, partial [Pseudolysinimonas sp.]